MLHEFLVTNQKQTLAMTEKKSLNPPTNLPGRGCFFKVTLPKAANAKTILRHSAA